MVYALDRKQIRVVSRVGIIAKTTATEFPPRITTRSSVVMLTMIRTQTYFLAGA
jgi:hypothetical protein